MSDRTPSAADGRPIRVGVIGIGWAGQQHLAAYDALPDTEIVAIAGMEATEVNARWQAERAPYFESLDGARPDEAMTPLTEVFHIA